MRFERIFYFKSIYLVKRSVKHEVASLWVQLLVILCSKIMVFEGPISQERTLTPQRHYVYIIPLGMGLQENKMTMRGEVRVFVNGFPKFTDFMHFTTVNST